MRTDPQPEDLRPYYPPEDYYSYMEPPRPSRAESVGLLMATGQETNAPLWTRLRARMFKYGMPGLPPGPPGELLDVGSGSGAAMVRLEELGWRTTGVELDPDAVAAARRAGIERMFCGDLLEATFPADSFDVVRFWHVLEHVRRPAAELAEARRILRPGGKLIIGVPSAAMLFHLFRERWFYLDVPRHLWHFDRRTITKMLQQSGFEIERMRHVHGSTALLGSIDRALGLNERLLEHRVAWHLVRPLTGLLNWAGLGDALEVVATPRPDPVRRPSKTILEPGESDRIWPAVDRLLASARSDDDIRAHRLDMFAIASRQGAGEEQSAAIVSDARVTSLISLLAPVRLRRIAEAIDAPVVLFKGPEVAAYYPDPRMRPYSDLDLLVADPEGAQQDLLDAGFEEIGDPERYIGHHHLRPLRWPGGIFAIELHRVPSVMSWMTVPSTPELIERSIPSALGIENLRTLPPAEHALILAAHSWGHWPLGRALDLLDILMVARDVPRDELEQLSHEWGMSRVWDTTLRAARALFVDDSDMPWTLKTWGRAVTRCRDHGRVERRLVRSLSPFAALPASMAIAEAGRGLQRGLKLRP